MRILLSVFLLLTSISCSQQNATIDQLHSTMKQMDNQIDKTLNNIRRTSDEYGFNEEPLNGKLKRLTEVFETCDESLSTSTTKGEIFGLLNQWNLKINETFSSELSLEVNQELGIDIMSWFAREQLRIQTIKLYNDVLESIHPPEPKFSKIETIIRPEIKELNLGETYQAQIYLGVSLPKPVSFVDFFYNDEKLEISDDGFAILEVTPSKRGKFTLEVEARGKTKSQITKDMKFVGTSSFYVK